MEEDSDALLSFILENPHLRLSPLERTVTFPRLKRAIDSPTVNVALVKLYLLMSLPMVLTKHESSLCLSRDRILVLLHAFNPLCIPLLAKWKDDSEVLALLQPSDRFIPPKSFISALLSQRLRRQLRKGHDVSKELLSAFFGECGTESGSWLTEISSAGRTTCTPCLRACFELPRECGFLLLDSRNEFQDLSETVWPASCRLAEMLLDANSAVVVAGRNVLEVLAFVSCVLWTGVFFELSFKIGAGTGLAGLAAARAGAARVWLSDNSDAGLELLRGNIVLNKCGETCAAVSLDWTDSEAELEASVVLVADCWYSQVLHLREAQAALVQRVLRKSKANKEESFAIVVAADRADGTVQHFVKAYEVPSKKRYLFELFRFHIKTRMQVCVVKAFMCPMSTWRRIVLFSILPLSSLHTASC
jgi:hypothetical protein